MLNGRKRIFLNEVNSKVFKNHNLVINTRYNKRHK